MSREKVTSAGAAEEARDDPAGAAEASSCALTRSGTKSAKTPEDAAIITRIRAGAPISIDLISSSHMRERNRSIAATVPTAERQRKRIVDTLLR
jgi:hypothetical protein